MRILSPSSPNSKKPRRSRVVMSLTFILGVLVIVVALMLTLQIQMSAQIVSRTVAQNNDAAWPQPQQQHQQKKAIPAAAVANNRGPKTTRSGGALLSSTSSSVTSMADWRHHLSQNTNHTAVALWSLNLPDDVVVHHVGPPPSPDNNNKPAPATIVTAYFRVKSKYSSSNYENQWMPNILSLLDPMVIFTQPGPLVETMKQHRQHAPTIIVELELEDLPVAYLRNPAKSAQEPRLVQVTDENGTSTMQTEFPFWVHQLDIDAEKSRHKSYQLFWIWLSKTWLVQQAVRRNWFDSDFFLYSDIGCFRRKNLNNKVLINPKVVYENKLIVPDQNTLLWMAHHPPIAPPSWLWNDKQHEKQHYYHSGSQGAGHATAWTLYLQELAITLDAFVRGSTTTTTQVDASKEMFVGEDQCVLQATCQRQPHLCHYFPFDQVADNHYFGLRSVLHGKPAVRGQYQPWRPPATTTS